MPKSVQSSKFNKAGRIKLKQSDSRKHPHWLQISSGMLLGYKRTKTASKWYAKFNGTLVGDPRKYLQLIIGIADDTADADGHEVLNLEQAQSKLHAIKKAMCEEVYAKPQKDSITFAKAVDLYWEAYKIRKPRINWGYKRYLEIAKAYDIPFRKRNKMPIQVLGQVKLDDITLEDLNSIRDGIAKRTRQKDYKLIKIDHIEKMRRRQATANKVVTNIKAVLNYAYKNSRETHFKSNKEYINWEKFPEVEKARPDWLDGDECQRWINYCNEPSLKNLFIGAISCGFRFGEQSHLRVRNVTLDAATPFINVPAEITKSNRERAVIIPKHYIEFYTTLTANRNGADYLFERVDGKKDTMYWKRNTYQGPYHTVREAAGLKYMQWHCLRHSYASQLVNAGVPLKIVAEQLGHSTTTLVERWYGHLSNKVVQDAMDNLPTMNNLITDQAAVVRIRRTNYSSTGNKTHQPKLIDGRSRHQIWAKPDNAESLLRHQNDPYFKELAKARKRGESKVGDWSHLAKKAKTSE
tara:strand:- start:669 stop:2234 length:1566 start_codon:yes stop_codon:yes gene_type:complete